jgi:hypothetical protein
LLTLFISVAEITRFERLAAVTGRHWCGPGSSLGQVMSNSVFPVNYQSTLIMIYLPERVQ